MRTLLLTRSEVKPVLDPAVLVADLRAAFRAYCALLVVFSLAGLPRYAWALPGGAAVTCSEVPSQVIFHGLQTLPETPKVGDAVELHFDVDYLVYSVTSLRLEGATPFLEGTTSLDSTRDATFKLTAAQPGTASVQLVVTYGTEEQCVDSYGYTYFRFGPDHTVTSPSYFIEITQPALSCPGDCNGNGQVSVDELVVGVNIALGEASLVGCASLDRNGDGLVAINELIGAINAALVDCAHQTQPSPTPTPTRTNPPGMCCCAATSFEECQALARQGTCFGWGDPCPTPTPTATPPATVGPEVPELVMQHAAASLCSGTSSVEGTAITCDAGPGHYGHVSLAGYVDVTQAQAAFATKGDGEEESIFSGAVLRIESRPNPCCPSLDGRTQIWRWQSGCWIISGNAFDDTPFLLAPQPRPSIEAIVNAADEVDLLSRCLTSDAAHQSAALAAGDGGHR